MAWPVGEAPACWGQTVSVGRPRSFRPLARCRGMSLNTRLTGPGEDFYLVAQPLDPPEFQDYGLCHLLQKKRRNQPRYDDHITENFALEVPMGIVATIPKQAKYRVLME